MAWEYVGEARLTEPIIEIEVIIRDCIGEEIFNETFYSVDSLEEDLYKLYHVEEGEIDKQADYGRDNLDGLREVE